FVLDSQSGEAIVDVANACKLDEIARDAILVERQAHTSIDNLSIGILMATEDQSTILGAFVVQEEDASARTSIRCQFFAPHDNAWELVMIRNHHPQRTIWLDHLDAMNDDLIEVLASESTSCEPHQQKPRRH